MDDKNLQPLPQHTADQTDIRQQISEAQQALLAAEAELAQEQAAVNAFRMHCRLKLDDWINRLSELQAEKQRLQTRLALLRQALDFGIPFDASDPFWQGEEESIDSRLGDEEDELILPTDTPRDKAAEKRLYRQLARRFHPDLGMTAVEIAYRTDMMSAVNQAYERQDIQALYDLAGELEPDEMASLAAIPSLELRRLNQQLFRLKQRRRRAERRLAAARRENTARLWQKAQRLEQDDLNWWEVVRREIERANERLESEITQLQAVIDQIEQAQVATESADQETAA